MKYSMITILGPTASGKTSLAADEYIQQNSGLISIELANEPVRVHLSDGHGWYTGNEMKVLCILAKKKRLLLLLWYLWETSTRVWMCF